MVELKIPGNAATRYAAVLAARGIELRQLSQLAVSLLDECDMRSSHRQVLKASGVLLTGLENEEAFNTAAAPPSTPTASGTAAADSTATDDDDDAATAEEAHLVVSAELDGARALAPSLKGNTSLSARNLRDNELDVMGATAVADARLDQVVPRARAAADPLLVAPRPHAQRLADRILRAEERAQRVAVGAHALARHL